MKTKQFFFTLVVFLLCIASVKTFAEPPLLSISFNTNGSPTAYASHTVTLDDIENLNAGTHVWNVIGSQSGNISRGYFVKVNGSTVYSSNTPYNNFSTQITLQVGDIVELRIDLVTGEQGGSGSSSGTLQIVIN